MTLSSQANLSYILRRQSKYCECTEFFLNRNRKYTLTFHWQKQRWSTDGNVLTCGNPAGRGCSFPQHKSHSFQSLSSFWGQCRESIFIRGSISWLWSSWSIHKWWKRTVICYDSARLPRSFAGWDGWQQRVAIYALSADSLLVPLCLVVPFNGSRNYPSRPCFLWAKVPAP